MLHLTIGENMGCAIGARQVFVAMLYLILGSTSVYSSDVRAHGENNSYIPLRFLTDPPTGARGICEKFEWVCVVDLSDKPEGDVFALVERVNREINESVVALDDVTQYNVLDFWALPSDDGGDCEDIALMKKQSLMKEGVRPDALLLATVIEPGGTNHAVLVFRSPDGDYILDNLVDEVKLWHKTRHYFLKIQDPDNPRLWRAVLSDGV